MAKKKTAKRSKHQNFMPSQAIHPSVLVSLICLLVALIAVIIFGNSILNTS